MPWNFDFAEALDRCRRLGGPADQQALLTLLQEVQEHCGGALPMEALEEIACAFSLRVSFLSAMVRRSLHHVGRRTLHRRDAGTDPQPGHKETIEREDFL